MAGAASLRVVIVKPSKYGADGFVERFRRGFMPNSTVPYIASMTPGGSAAARRGPRHRRVRPDGPLLSLAARSAPGVRDLLALVGVQSHQFHRALDLAAYARADGRVRRHRRAAPDDLRHVDAAGPRRLLRAQKPS